MPHTWGTSDRYQSLVFGCALETFYNPFMCTHRVPVRSWAPATCLSGDMSRKSALKSQFSLSFAVGWWTHHLTKLSLSHSSIKWKLVYSYINQYMLLPWGFNDIVPVEHLGVHTLTDSKVCCGCCCWQSQGTTTHSYSPLEDPASTPPSLHTEWEKQKLPLPMSDLRVEHFIEVACFKISRRAEHSTEGQG